MSQNVSPIFFSRTPQKNITVSGIAFHVLIEDSVDSSCFSKQLCRAQLNQEDAEEMTNSEMEKLRTSV